MDEIEFRRFFTDDDLARVRFTVERGKIQRFMIQLECRISEKWYAIVRYDNAHGFAHRDLFRPRYPAEKTQLDVVNLNVALTFAQNDILKNWLTYRRRFEKWLSEK